MPVEDVIRAVNALDLKTFSLENVEILQRMLPTESEVIQNIYFQFMFQLFVNCFLYYSFKK
jgi:hypothetical protein